MPTYKVVATSLNFRTRPKLQASNRIGVLPQGHLVTPINKEQNPWWFVKTSFRGISLEGYVHSKFLASTIEFPELEVASNISEVHLMENKTLVTRKRDGGRAYPLGEANRPERNSANELTKRVQLGEIISWLSVDKSKRYKKKGSTTYCNIYAYDYCYLAGVYIPRVWWKQKALLELSKGNSVKTHYGSTVKELNANALHDWFEDFGEDFGWFPSFDVDECQHSANQGNVVIICAKRVTTNRSGHICLVVPETKEHRAEYSKNGEVKKLLQSQAGSSNFTYKANYKWWTSQRFQSFGFWIHE